METISASATSAREAARSTGGKFGPQEIGEADVQLSCEPDDRREYGGLTEDEIFDCCDKAARHWARRYDLDADDLRSDTAIAFLERVRSSTQRGSADGSEPIDAHRSYISATARSIALKSATGLKGGRNMKALSTYLRRRDEWEHTNQARMPARQEDALADEVRASQPPGYRPPADFHRARKDPETPTESDTMARMGGSASAEEASGLARVDGFATGSIGEQVEDTLDAGDKKSAKAQVWDAIAQARNAPMTATGSLTPAQAAKARKTVRENGGIAEVADSIDGHEQGPLTRAQGAVMAPFGRDDADGRRAVGQMLREFPDNSDDLWEAAVLAASHPRPGQAA